MSLRDLFAAKAETHSRKRRAKQAELIPAQVERLETRALLSAIVPGLNQHGILFTNANVAGRTSLTFDGSINPQISGNVNGAGLFIDINGNTGLRELTLTGLQARNNGSAGAVINLSNLQLDRLVISSSVFAGNGTAGSGAGLVLQLNNAQIGEILIAGSRFNLNEFSGLQINSAAGTAITSLRALNNRAVQNVAADGMAFLLNGSSVQNLGFANNILQQNGTNGFQLKLTNTPISNLIVRDNVANENQNGHGVFLDFIGSAVTTQIYRNQLTNQAAGDGMRIRTQFSASGLRNISLARFSVNVFEGNAGNGFFATLARDTTLRGQILRNEFRNNGGVGFGASAEDTENAIDLQIGSFTRINNELVHANTFDQNTGAAIALTLQDPSGALGDTTGRVRIFANTITGTQAGTIPLFTGSGILIRAIGSTVLANGAARWSQVRIDGNTIRSNAGHGVMFDISEDSQLVDAIIGNNTGTKLRFDVDGDFSIPGQQIIREANDGNLIEDNGGNGITFARRDSAVLRDIRIVDNVVRRNQNGIGLLARNTYQAVPNAAVQGLLVSQFIINNNQVRDNVDSGISLRTEADAVMLADIKYNFIDGNGQHGIRASGLENNDTDFENIGGTWVKNRISNNGQNGISIETVVGHVNPLRIGLDGEDAEFEPFQLGNQSLGNYIFRNGNDGIAIAAQIGLAGTVRPQDSFRNSASIINNVIVENGTNTIAGGATPDPLTAGKGIRIEIFWGRQGGTGDLREVRIDRNTIQGNYGDGIELRNRGGTARLIMLGNLIDLNGGRGMDVLNQTGPTNFDPEAHIVFGRLGTTTVRRIIEGTAQNIAVSNGNIVRSNGLEGFYVVNTASSNQTADVDSRVNLLADAAFPSQYNIFTNLMVDMENNAIRDNGRGITETGSPASTLSGTGLVFRVGTSNSAGFYGTVPDITGNASPFTDSALAGVGTNTSELGNGRVNARVVNNDFSGNAGDDVFMESFTSTVDPPSSAGTWTEKEFKVANNYSRDPLARMNLVFRGNTGDSLDVVRGYFDANGDTNNAGAFYNNDEGTHKSRIAFDGANPDGPFHPRANRARNAQRVADRPSTLGGLALAWAGFSGDLSGASSFWGIPFDGPNVPNAGFGSLESIDGSNLNGPIVVTAGSRSGTIFDATNANPSVITAFGHGLFDGQHVIITGAEGNTAINNTGANPRYWIVRDATFSTFELENPITGLRVAGNGAYTTNSATFTQAVGITRSFTIDDAVDHPTTANTTIITAPGHGLNTNDMVSITGAQGNTAINGSWVVTVIDASQFTINVEPNGIYVAGSATATTTSADPQSGVHSLSTGDLVTISGTGTRADGTHVVLVPTLASGLPDQSRFALYAPVDLGFHNRFTDTFSGGTPVPGDGFSGSAGSFSQYVVHNFRKFHYDGIGPSTFRVESNWDIAGFTQNQFGDTFDPSHPEGQQTFNPNIFVTGTIQWDAVDPGTFSYVTAWIDDVAVNETAGTATFTVHLSEAAKETVVIDYETADGTAVAGSDYSLSFGGGTLFFAPGQTSRTFTVNILNNNAFDAEEHFYVDLVSISGGSLVDSRAFATINPDSDARPTVSVSDTTVFPEGRQAAFTVTLSNPSSETIFVDFRTADGTAIDGQDYLERVGTLIFNPGETSKMVEINTLLDQSVEAPETFQLLLSNAQTTTGPGTTIPLTIADSQGVGTIFDTAFVQLPSQVFANGYIQAGSDTSTAEVTINLSRPVPSGQSVTLNYTTSNGSALAGGFNPDYVSASGTVTFNAGEQSKTISITVNRDTFQEGNEFFFVNFTDGGNAVFAEGANTQVRVVIREPGEVAALGEGSFPVFRTFDGVSGEVVYQVLALPGSFRGGLRVATGDMNGDGFPDIIAAAGPGGGPAVAIFDGVDGSRIGTPFFALPSTFRGGLTLATGDIDGDGTLEIIVGADAGGAPVVGIFDASGNRIGDPFFPFDMSFRGGVNVAAGDVDGDGNDEIIVGSGPGQTRVVRVYDAENAATTPPTEKFSFEPFGSGGSLGGVVVTAGNVTGSANEEIIVGVQSDGLAGVAVFDGTTGARIGDIFLALPAGFRGGVRLATTQIDGGGFAEVMVGVGPGGGPVVSYYSFNGTTFTKLSQFFAFGRDNRAGVYVAGRGVGPGEGSPLHADGPAPAGTPSVAPISEGDLSPIVDAALDRFESAGLNAGSLEQLTSVEFIIADLGGTLLGLARPGVILIDDDAAGYGWFVDYSPMLDEEFGRDGSGTLTASDSAAAGRMDLLTTVMHELGHELGWTDLDAGQHANDLMTGTLRTGVRRDLDSVFATEDLFDSLLTA